MLSEGQIRSEYQNKGYLTKLLKEVIYNSDKSRYDDVLMTINSKNIVSQNIFKHIGFKQVNNNLYKISYKVLVEWLNNR